MELREIDVNLLLVFDQMLKQKRVSDVAATLDLSQPAISNALARLRRLLGDELFLLDGNGVAMKSDRSTSDLRHRHARISKQFRVDALAAFDQPTREAQVTRGIRPDCRSDLVAV